MVQLVGGDRHAISRTAAPDAPIAGEARTAIIMPICNEDVNRVFAGLRASYASLARSGDLEHFDFFVLSDSGDPDARAAEVEAWHRMCRELDCFDRVFYRWRQHRIKKKSGNVADFCRRWGKNYRYMIGFDADSVMTGDCLGRLVRLMEANPDAGIIQTGPRAAGRDTFYARMQQFATRVYGPLFTAGLHYWQLAESHYWGHNAIIRVEPFMRHCAGAPARQGLAIGRDPLPRLRRGGAHASRRLGRVARLRPARQLRGDAAQPRRRAQARPPLVPGQPHELPAVPVARPASGPPRGVHDRGDGLPVGAAVVPLADPVTVLLAMHTLSEPQYFVEPNQLFPLWPGGIPSGRWASSAPPRRCSSCPRCWP